MSAELRKKAVDLLLKGATLLAEPCPYCKGVRIMNDGNALCIGCGKEPDHTKVVEKPKEETPKTDQSTNPILDSLNKKLDELTKELEAEKDHEKQQSILKSVNAVLETMQKLQK
jgi:UPF0148 protein